MLLRHFSVPVSHIVWKFVWIGVDDFPFCQAPSGYCIMLNDLKMTSHYVNSASPEETEACAPLSLCTCSTCDFIFFYNK